MPGSYRQEHASDADVLDPRWWNLNQAEFAGKFNGGMDRDDLPEEVVSEGMFSLETLLDCDSSTLGGADTWTPTMTTTDWQDFDPTNNLAGAISVVAPVDCHLEIDWSGTWEWNGAYSRAVFGTTYAVDTVAVRVIVNGIVVCESGPSEDGADRDCLHILGDIAIGPGSYTVQVQVRVGRLTYRGSDLVGVCTNTCLFREAALVVLERRR